MLVNTNGNDSHSSIGHLLKHALWVTLAVYIEHFLPLKGSINLEGLIRSIILCKTKLEGHGFGSQRGGHWISSVDLIFPAALWFYCRFSL
jgi:hypothetical protein